MNTPPPAHGQFSLQQTRALLAALGHSPRRPLGQNFLVDANIVRKSLQLASVSSGDVVVEIGAGLGTLTGALLAAGAVVHAVECDATLARHLREWLVPLYPKTFFLTEGDAMEFPLAGLPTAPMGAGNAAGDFKIVANLPYAISTPWMDAVLAGPVPSEMVLMLQRETAERFTARPGSKAFGGISVALDAACERAPGHKVPSGCFFPPPQVDSYLLHLRRRATPRRLHPETRRFIRALFLHRRKQLGAILKKLPDAPAVAQAWLERLGEWDASPQTRPEAVPFAAWYALDDAFVSAADL
ncbi:MAG: 16S rRNA (adenine(1518)-N(6)/adenine(1519)-N(6))-dimethyltransferase RsmA [Puniceicoccales bacterium]|jgi:16S rRNA (adenine1518-N6/adenine1519-N6)-dimethyltransferase|nr:16S rRNA (adenine(1518)-N(6)/adenine(1519)-N(6))-dimethyltransferase RsmA [Puniceicoccales bacterium]